MVSKLETQQLDTELSHEDIEFESKQIMTRIYNYEAQKKKIIPIRGLIAVAAVLLFALIPLFNPQDAPYGIKKINANEYRLNIFGDSIYFNVFALVENHQKVPLTDRFGTYEGFQKYYDVSQRIKVEMIEINGFIFLEIKQGDEVIEYLYVRNIDEHNRNLAPLDRDFKDFEREMTAITNLVKENPFEYNVENGYCYNPKDNLVNDTLSEGQKKDYIWFRDIQAGLCSQDAITNYEYVLYLDGTINDIGHFERSMHRVGGTYNPKESDFPIYFIPNDMYSASSFEGTENGLSVQTNSFVFEGDEFGEFAVAARLDLGKYSLDDIEIEIVINDEALTNLSYLQADHYLYILPQFVQPNVKTEGDRIERTIDYYIKITDKKTKDIVYQSIDTQIYSQPKD